MQRIWSGLSTARYYLKVKNALNAFFRLSSKWILLSGEFKKGDFLNGIIWVESISISM